MSTADDQSLELGAKGVYLKKFERVVAKILPTVRPAFVKLPHETEDPYGELPKEARVHGEFEGQLSNRQRGERKENQIRSLLRCIKQLIPADRSSRSRPYTIVDFGGGSGHLAIPIALLYSDCKVVVVDLKEKTLQLLKKKAKQCPRQSQDTDSRWKNEQGLERSESIPNLYLQHSPVQDFMGDVDMGLALHLCGDATDIALRKCKDASVVIFSPCCVGKVSDSKKNPYRFQATGSNDATVSYPQSSTFCKLIQKDDWNALAQAADFGIMEQYRSPRNAARRCAKSLLETDRRFFLEEQFGFETALTRMSPWDASPKNDIIVAWKMGVFPRIPDDECSHDVDQTIKHLFEAETTKEEDSNDWTKEEETEYDKEVQNFVDSSRDTHTFPPGIGGRKRKLIHFLAERARLDHWSEGKRENERAVVIARKGYRQKKSS